MKILIVEDERGLREALIKSLTDEGYMAEGAEDGEIGLDMIETGVYDLVLLDIMLPKMSGFEVLSKVRAKKTDVPIILLTARTQLDDKITGMDKGADDYLTKPFEMEELFARIRMVSRRAHKVSVDNTLSVGNLMLNVQTYELSCSDNIKTVRLGTKEFQLLEYMMHNAGIVLSREQITEKIWGFDSEAEYNNVDVYISFVRKKIKFVGANVTIMSVRNVGYALNGEKL
ncbi:MAG: response regulator transcription factor [Acetatifactor sp.]|nr:response regulator transcription factor [Acetatifactor sp.]